MEEGHNLADIDVLILGGGTGGYETAIRAAELGLKTVIVEKDKLGGTCLHRGCIPSKALLRTAEVMALAKEAETFGVQVTVKGLDYKKSHDRKQKIVDQLHKGVEGLVKKAGITVYKGMGTLMPPSIFAPAGAVSVETEGGERELLSPGTLIIATGSVPRALPGLPFDGKRVINSDHALEMLELPKDIIIVGAGAIGCEWASLYSDLGVRVILIEVAEHILPLEDLDVSRVLERVFGARGVEMRTGTKVDPASYKEEKGKATIEVTDAKGEKTRISADHILVAVGRAPVVDGYGLDNFQKVKVVGGKIEVDGYCRTGDPNIFAIGDVIGGLQLAHVAVHEGEVAVETIAGMSPEPVNYVRLPRCTYTRPEVASVGYTEADARATGQPVKVGKFFFKANGKALIYGESEGLCKVITNEATKDILGVHIIGPHATDLIQEGVFAQWMEATSFDMAAVNHPHPTLVEILNDAAMAAENRTA